MDCSDDQTLFPEPGKTPREDTSAVMKFYGLRDRFPPAALAEARRCRAGSGDAGGRLDLRGKFIFTCDPVTARDYDDALSIDRGRGGSVVLGVHIADVSHYVRPGSALDREAYRRSTSVYFADRVVPMLPEELSNGVCSLVPGEDRLAFSVFMTFDADGAMTKSEFARSVIRSSARFTYEQVMRIISEGGASRRTGGAGAAGRRARAAILSIHALAQKLRAARFAAGALDIDIPETELVLDAEGGMSGIVTRPYDESHQMVEECMVAANEAVARELWGKGVRILARLHEPPDPEKLLALRAELRGLGLKPGNLENQKVLSRFLSSVRGHPLYPTIALTVLRSMKRAVYDGGAIGHYGLAKRYYAHFTSPIRRYPDLTLHRQLAARLAGGNCRVPGPLLEKWAAHASEAEQNAAAAERALLEIKKYRLLDEQISSGAAAEYDAVVVRCAAAGCFVEIPELAVSGLVHISLLSPGRYVRYNASDASLSAPGGGSWRIGDRMKVKAVRVDFRQRRIDFAPAEAGRPRLPGRGGPHGRRGNGIIGRQGRALRR